jgi:hypothetical protein
MRTTRFVCRLVLPVSILLFSLNGAGAQSDEVRQACTPDAMRLCSEFIPDAGKVRTCMMRKRRELSAECIAAMHGGGGHRGGRHEVYRHHRHHCRHCG